MIRKFECKNCGAKFSLEEKGQVKCPQCCSDNVDYATVYIPYKYICIAVCAVIVVLLLSKIDYNSVLSVIYSHEKDTTEKKNNIPDNDGVYSSNQEALENEIRTLGIDIPPTIKGISKMELDDDGNYNVTVEIEHAPEEGFCVQISDVKTGKVVANSSNGTFKGVPFSSNDGKYYAKIVNASTNKALSEQTEITGFVEYHPISKKLSKLELQDLINRKDPSLLGHDNKYLSPVYKISYENLLPDDLKPDNLGDIFVDMIPDAWTSVEVTSLKYDDTNHISLIKLKVKKTSHPDFDN